MASNSFGNYLKYLTWGESHGSHIGCVVDGVPSGIELSESYIQPFLDNRKPGNSQYTSARKEEDKVKILSGVFEGKTTGAPISMIVENKDYRSKDYSHIKNTFRPGHADYTYFLKYKNFNDYRGGGRASARETAMRVAAGAIARKIIPDITIKGFVSQIGNVKAEKLNIHTANSQNLYCPDPKALELWQNNISKAQESGDSLGSIVEVHAYGVPAGLGEPVYNKLNAALGQALMSINAVKGVEIGDGFALCTMQGSNANDEIAADKEGNISFTSNHSGGIIGGLSNGAPIILRVAVKPPSSIRSTLKTVDKNRNNTTICTSGRHDPCIGPRCVPVAEAMVCLTIADYYMLSKISDFKIEDH